MVLQFEITPPLAVKGYVLGLLCDFQVRKSCVSREKGTIFRHNYKAHKGLRSCLKSDSTPLASPTAEKQSQGLSRLHATYCTICNRIE